MKCAPEVLRAVGMDVEDVALVTQYLASHKGAPGVDAIRIRYGDGGGHCGGGGGGAEKGAEGGAAGGGCGAGSLFSMAHTIKDPYQEEDIKGMANFLRDLGPGRSKEVATKLVMAYNIRSPQLLRRNLERRPEGVLRDIGMVDDEVSIVMQMFPHT